jgi:hypothetical protein
LSRSRLWGRYKVLEKTIQQQVSELAEVATRLQQARKGLADRAVVVETMAYLGELLDKMDPAQVKSLLPRFVEAVEVTEKEIRVGIFERPSPATYSITKILGNEAIEAKKRRGKSGRIQGSETGKANTPEELDPLGSGILNGSRCSDWLPRQDSNLE